MEAERWSVYIVTHVKAHNTHKRVVPTEIKMLGLDWVLTLGGRF